MPSRRNGRQKNDNKKAYTPTITTDQLCKEVDAQLAGLAAAMNADEFQARIAALLRVAGSFHRYSLRNLILLSMQAEERGLDLSMVNPFNRWLRLNRCVRKGQKGLAIVAPCPYTVTDKETGEEERRVRGFKTEWVFDVSMTDVLPGKPDLLEQARLSHEEVSGDYEALYSRIKSAVARMDITLVFAHMAPGTRGQSNGQGTIALSEGISSSAERCQVLLHELAHELCHRDRTEAYHDDPSVRRRRECQAEAIAHCVASRLGLEWPNTVSYLALYGVDAEVLRQNLDEIVAGVRMVLDAVLGGNDDQAKGEAA